MFSTVLSDNPNPNPKVDENADESIEMEEKLLREHLERQRQFEHEASLRVKELRTGFTTEAADVPVQTEAAADVPVQTEAADVPVQSSDPNLKEDENADDDWEELSEEIEEYQRQFQNKVANSFGFSYFSGNFDVLELLL